MLSLSEEEQTTVLRTHGRLLRGCTGAVGHTAGSRPLGHSGRNVPPPPRRPKIGENARRLPARLRHTGPRRRRHHPPSVCHGRATGLGNAALAQPRARSRSAGSASASRRPGSKLTSPAQRHMAVSLTLAAAQPYSCISPMWRAAGRALHHRAWRLVLAIRRLIVLRVDRALPGASRRRVGGQPAVAARRSWGDCRSSIVPVGLAAAHHAGLTTQPPSDVALRTRAAINPSRPNGRRRPTRHRPVAGRVRLRLGIPALLPDGRQRLLLPGPRVRLHPALPRWDAARLRAGSAGADVALVPWAGQLLC